MEIKSVEEFERALAAGLRIVAEPSLMVTTTEQASDKQTLDAALAKVGGDWSKLKIIKEGT